MQSCGCSAFLSGRPEIKRHSTLPTCETVTSQLQQWHVPPKQNVAPKRVSDITFHKASYGKLENQKSATTEDVSKSTGIEHNIPIEDDRLPDDDILATLVQTITSTCTQSRLAHFWLTPSSDQANSTLMPYLAEDHDVQDGLMQLTRKLIIWDGINITFHSQPLNWMESTQKLNTSNNSAVVQWQEQIIDSTLSNFIEQVTHGQSICDL